MNRELQWHSAKNPEENWNKCGEHSKQGSVPVDLRQVCLKEQSVWASPAVTKKSRPITKVLRHNHWGKANINSSGSHPGHYYGAHTLFISNQWHLALPGDIGYYLWLQRKNSNGPRINKQQIKINNKWIQLDKYINALKWKVQNDLVCHVVFCFQCGTLALVLVCYIANGAV